MQDKPSGFCIERTLRRTKVHAVQQTGELQRSASVCRRSIPCIGTVRGVGHTSSAKQQLHKLSKVVAAAMQEVLHDVYAGKQCVGQNSSKVCIIIITCQAHAANT